MTQARAHLRVCDAYGNRKAAVVLDQTFYELGSDQTRAALPGYIHLTGSGVSPRHARLIWQRSDNTWQVTPLTAQGGKIGRRAIGQDAETPLTTGDELWLGNNLLQLLETHQNVSETITNAAVSYTHLTLPTILLV